MERNIPFGVASATEIERHRCQPTIDTDTRVSACSFGKHAKLVWPFKTAAQVAAIANTSERQAARMLTGEFEPPASVVAALVAEIFKRP